MSRNLKYRADIDALRAVAVLGVVVFHIDPAWMPGGYTGVDIFFVISGFLITSIIAAEMAAGQFSFAAFYRRRILRIAPAYVVVTVVTVVAGMWLLLPEDLAELARSAAWSAASLPNIYFWAFLDTGYFAAESEEMPLLHLWSLGVEEQFYLAWPLLLLAAAGLRRRRAALLSVLAVLAALSFLHAQQQLGSDVSYAYYMLPARAGELLVGAIVALAVAGRPPQRSGGPAFEVVALAGLALIAYGLVVLDEQSPFPGINALIPCIGTGLVILAGAYRDCSVSRLISIRPMLWIGLISYSLYLWHWPVLAFMRYFLSELGPLEAASSAVAMLVLSVLSYRYVEVPFRSAGWSAARVIGGYLLLVGVLAFACVLIVRSDGLESVLASDPAYARGIERLDAYTAPAFRYDYNCQAGEFDPRHFKRRECVVGAGEGDPEPRVLIVGDSNAAHFVGLLGAFGEKAGFSFRNAEFGSCPPIFGAGRKYGPPGKEKDCARFRAQIRKEAPKYDYVFLGGQWMSNQRRPGFERDLRRTVRQLSRDGRQVILMAQIPQFPAYDRSCELRRLRLPAVDCQARATGAPQMNKRANDLLFRIAASSSQVRVLDIRPVICDQGCSPYLDGKPLYFDRSHLSMDGSWRLGRKMVAEMPEGSDLEAILRRFSGGHPSPDELPAEP